MESRKLCLQLYPHGTQVTKPGETFFYSCNFPFFTHGYEYGLSGFKNMSDDAIVKFLQEMDKRRKSMEALKDRVSPDMLEIDLKATKSKTENAVTALAVRYKNDDAKIVDLLQAAGEIGTNYLPVAVLPADALLAPLARK